MSKHLGMSGKEGAGQVNLPKNLESCFRKLQTRATPDDDATDEWSSGLEDGRQPDMRLKKGALGIDEEQEKEEEGSPDEEASPPLLLPAFSSDPFSEEAILETSPGQPTAPTSNAQSNSAAYGSFLRAERRLSLAVARLNSIQKQQAIHTAISQENPSDHRQSGSNSILLAGIPYFPPSSPNIAALDNHNSSRPSTPPTQTPRRSRLARAFSPSPSSTASPGSPRIPRSPQPGTPNTTSRRWSSALQAILSPSPSLPRTYSPNLASTSPSPSANGEWQHWENLNSTDAVRKAQADLLSAVRKLAEEQGDIVIGPQGLKESVLVCAESIACGLNASMSCPPNLQSASEDLQRKSRSLVQAFQSLRTQQAHTECPSSPILANLNLATVFQETLSKTCCQAADEEDVFAAKYNDSSAIPFQVRRFVDKYREFGEAVIEYDAQVRAERRKTRLERRLTRISKANALYQLESTRPDEDASLNIATMSSQELFQHALRRAVQAGLYTLDDIESFEPRLLLTLPRLALLYGVQESQYPIGCEEKLDQDPALQTPLEVFLPRLCRALPLQVIRTIRQTSDTKTTVLARRLCAIEEIGNMEDLAIDSGLDLVFRSIASEADEGGMTGKAGRHIKLMKRVFKLYLAENGHAVEAEDEVNIICKSMLIGAGLIR